MNAWTLALGNMATVTVTAAAKCERCGAVIDPKTTNGRVRKYCGKACSDLASVDRKRTARGMKSCPYCGGLFAGRANSRFCSKACATRMGFIERNRSECI